MRRFVLLAVVVGSQLAAGCYSRPYLQGGWGCGSGSCGLPVIDRPILNRPVIERPILNRPILPYAGVPVSTVPGYAGGEYGTPLPYYQPAPGGYPVGDPGCVGCNGGNGHHVGSVGNPFAGGPQGYPGAAGVPVIPAPMPMAMPGGIPHDSALLKMPTIVPPGTTSKRPEELARQTGGTK